MSMKDLEREILAELKTVANNPKLKMKDVLEWSTGDVKAEDGEVVVRLPILGVNCAILKTSLHVDAPPFVPAGTERCEYMAQTTQEQPFRCTMDGGICKGNQCSYRREKAGK